METFSILLAVAGAALGASGAWFAAKARSGRDLQALRGQLDAAEKARLQATQQWQQARREVERLQKDMMARGAVRAAPVSSAADAEQERTDRIAAAEAALQAASADGPPSALPAHGFADTQPMTTPGRL